MSAIDWDREFREPWRSLGKAFVEELPGILANKTSTLEADRRAMRETLLTREEIAAAAGVSLRFLEIFYSGETSTRSPMSLRVRHVLATAPKKPRPPPPWDLI